MAGFCTFLGSGYPQTYPHCTTAKWATRGRQTDTWSETEQRPPLTLEQNKNIVRVMFSGPRGKIMIRAVVEEAATLASLALFLGMIAVWAHVIAVL